MGQKRMKWYWRGVYLCEPDSVEQITEESEMQPNYDP